MARALADYRDAGVTGLLEDDYFRQWVLQPQAEVDRFWQAFLAHYPECKSTVDEARLLLTAIHQTYTPIQADDQMREADLARLQGRLGDQADSAPHSPPPSLRHYWWIAAAAVIVAVTTIGYCLLQPKAEVETVYATAFGEQRTILLPDSSSVILNANSRLRLPADWEKAGPRQIYLDGEAYFTVRKLPKARREFFVHTAAMSIRVTGTAFNVYSRGENTTVYLAEGSIQLKTQDGHPAVMLQAGEVISYSQQDRLLSPPYNESARLHTAWKEGALSFSQTPLPIVLRRLEEIYGARFHLMDDPLRRHSVSSDGIPVADLDIALSLLSQALGVVFEKKGEEDYEVRLATAQDK